MNTILDEIGDFIGKQGDELKLEHMVPISSIEDTFNDKGYMHIPNEEYGDTNGWEVGFSYHFQHETLAPYTIHGSLWYGNFKICKHKTDKDEENAT